jgi:hypothetical protein
MNIVEHLDRAIAALDAGAPPVEIKGHLVSMREQMEAYDEATQKHLQEIADLKKACAQRDELLAAYKANASLRSARNSRGLPG